MRELQQAHRERLGDVARVEAAITAPEPPAPADALEPADAEQGSADAVPARAAPNSPSERAPSACERERVWLSPGASAGQRLEASSSPVTPEPPDVLEGEYETDDFDGGGGGGLFSTLPPQFDDAFGPRVLPGDDEYVGDDEPPLPEPPPTSSC